MTAGGITQWTDIDGDGAATAVRNSTSSGLTDSQIRFSANTNVAETFNIKTSFQTGAQAPAAGVMWSTGIILRAGMLLTGLAFRTGSQAAVMGTSPHWWTALMSDAATPALLGQCADQTNTAIGSNGSFKKDFTSQITIPDTALYYTCLMVNTGAGGTQPTILCVDTNSSNYPNLGIITGDLPYAQTSGSSLGATAPSTIASPSSNRYPLYMVTY